MAGLDCSLFAAFDWRAFANGARCGKHIGYPLLTKYIFNGLADGRAADIIWMAPRSLFCLRW